MNILNSANTATTINKIIHNSQGTTTTTEGATAAGKIIKENLPDIISAGFDMPHPTSVFEGVPPFSFISNGDPLVNWIIYGNTGGVGDKIEITLDAPLNGISTYKDTLSLSTGKLTRKIKKLVLTGNEEWTQMANISESITRFYTRIITPTISATSVVSSHFKVLSGNENEQHIRFGTDSQMAYTVLYIFIPLEIASTLAELKTFLETQSENDTPVTIWYALSTPTETIITVPTGMTGTIEGYTTQTGTPTPETPIYPTSNGTLQPDDSYLVYTTYKIPVTCGGVTTNIYIDEPLTSGETISYNDTGVIIPTTMFLNTLSVGTTVQPEKVFIEYVK